MKKIFSLNKKILFAVLSMLSIVGYGVLVFAAAPNGGYAPGSTLDPACAPGDNDCFVTLASGGAVSIGDLIGGSVDPNRILYTNGDNELAIDDLFTRNSATKETTIARTFEGVPTTEMNITIKPVFFTVSSNNNLQEGEAFETIPSGVTGTISRIENLLSPETQTTATTPVFSGSGTNDLNVQEWDFNGVEPKNYTVTIIEKNAERATVSMNGIAFSVGETITGQTSGVTAEVVYSDNNYNIAFKNASGVFEYGETITSASTSGTIYPTGNSTDVFTISNSGYPTRGITYNGYQARVDGVYVSFSNELGHEIGDQWTFTVSESPVQYQILFLDNVSGINESIEGYQIVGQTSLATTGEGTFFISPIGSVGDNVITWSLSGEDGEDDPTSMGVITAINGEVYTVSGTGNPAQNDVFMNYDDDDNVSFVYSVNTNSIASLITTGFMSSNNILGLGVKGTGFIQTNNNAGIFSGVYDASVYGGSEMSIASSYFGPNNELAQFTISGGVAPVINLTSSNSSSDAGLTINPTSFLLETKQNGNTLFGFEATSSTIGWRSGNERYFLPTTIPNNGDILTVTNINGPDITLGFSSSGGGGGGSSAISVNGTTLYSSGLANTGSYSNSNIFLGNYAGNGATNAYYSNFLGYQAGYGATNAYYSNFLGENAGNSAAGANNSNFFGTGAGYYATNAFNSNFLGYFAGSGATSANNSNFLGQNAGQIATSANNSNFFGQSAGYNATNASNSNFLGYYAGNGATSAFYSNFLGLNAGYGATGASNSNFLGSGAGQNATSASNSNFFGQSAGNGATGASLSNFFGQFAGNGATGAYYSNFLGSSAGNGAYNASNSNFLGNGAGYSATSASFSNFFGQSAGNGATNASYSNFLGLNAGYGATSAYQSNFLGSNAGYGATGAYGSNFLGFFAGNGATSASNSNFFGSSAGQGAANANNSIFIGYQSGLSDLVNNTVNADDYSILIGPNTSTGNNGSGVGYSNSIAIGAYATNTASNQFMIGSATRTINEVVIVGSGTSCTIDNNIYGSGSTGLNCSSDERLKTNIEDLASTTLDTLLNVKTVRYNWNANPTGNKSIGFLAQDLQQYFPELVKTGHDGYLQVNYGGITPILVEVIREMNLKITTINDMETPNTWRDSLIAWFGNVENGIIKFFAGEIETKKLCIADDAGDKTCITKAQLDQLLNNSAGGSITPEPSQPSTPEGGDDNTSTGDVPEVDTAGTVNTGETSVDPSIPGADEDNGAPIDTPAPETSDNTISGDSSTSGDTAPEEGVSL